MEAVHIPSEESFSSDPVASIRSLYPFASHYAPVAEYKMHFVDEGKKEGPVVLLLHGNPTWSFYFRNLIKALSSSFRVIAPDMLGCGLSDRVPNETFRAKDRIEHLDEFLRYLGVTSFSLVMHDWGGPIGTGLALRRLEQVGRLVYLNTTLTEIEALPKIIRTAHTPFVGRFLTQLSPRFLDLTLEFGAVKRLPVEVKRGYRLPYQDRAARKAIWDFVADIPFTEEHPSYMELMRIAEGLPRLKEKPIKIVWGLQDPCFHKEMLSQIIRHFPHAEVTEFPEASHLVLEDEPERAIQSVEEFLIQPLSPSLNTQTEPFPDGCSLLYKSFIEAAETYASKEAVTLARTERGKAIYEHTSFAELKSLVYRFQRGLTELGIAQGDRVLFLFPLDREFVALVFACLGCGAVPVFVDPGVGMENLHRCVEDTDARVLISQLKGYALRLFWKGAFKHLKFHLVATDIPFFGGATLSFLKKYSGAACRPVVKSHEVGFIAYTSGGTGVPKGVIFTEEGLQASLALFKAHLGMTGGEKDLPLLPIFSLFNAALGITSVLLPQNPGKPLDLNPADVLQYITDLGVQSSFGSPTLWRKIAEYCIRHGRKLTSMKRIIMAGAPVPIKVLERVSATLPNGEVYTPYGATECLPVTVLSASEAGQIKRTCSREGWLGTLVGKKVPGIEIAIIRPLDVPAKEMSSCEVLPPYVIGEVVVCGAQVSPRYLHRSDATREAKIPDGEKWWHRMGDLGYLDEEGNLFFCGRKVHAVLDVQDNVTYYSIPVEKIVNEDESVSRSALISYHGRPAIVVEPLPSEFPRTQDAIYSFQEKIRQRLQTCPLTASIETIFFHHSFPVDGRHNAKIFRDVLGRWAEGLRNGVWCSS